MMSKRVSREGQRGPFLQHNSLLKIYAYVENKDGQAFRTRNPENPFILMDVVKGRTLESYIRRLAREQEAKGAPKIFSVDPARLSIAVEIANALEYLHRRRLVHRERETCEHLSTIFRRTHIQQRSHPRRLRYYEVGRLPSLAHYRDLNSYDLTRPRNTQVYVS